MQNNSHSPKSKVLRKDLHEGRIQQHLEEITREFKEGFEFIRQYPQSVSIFGSSQIGPENPVYQKAEELGRKIVTELNYAVLTGGGPGVMEAANKGASEASGHTAGLSISLPHEHSGNAFAKDSMRFSYFFARKTMLTFAAEAFVFFPGGFGTFDELFSIVTLIQTGKIPRVPVLLYDTQFWNTFSTFMNDKMSVGYHTIDTLDMGIFEITDSLDRIIEVIKKAPVSEWWRNIN